MSKFKPYQEIKTLDLPEKFRLPTDKKYGMRINKYGYVEYYIKGKY